MDEKWFTRVLCIVSRAKDFYQILLPIEPNLTSDLPSGLLLKQNFMLIRPSFLLLLVV